jgi:hypothetical protein
MITSVLTWYVLGGVTHPSGSTLIICFPMIKDELCRMLAGFTLFSDIDNSRSYKVLTTAAKPASIGI